MVSRFKRLAAPPEVTFFVFQDILTSMIGVMIMVTLTLGLQIDDNALDGNRDAKAKEELSKTLAQTLSEVSALRLKVAASGNTAGNSPSLATMEAEEANLRKQIALYEEINKARQGKADKLLINPASAAVASEVESLSRTLARTNAERDRMKAMVRETEAQLAGATQDVKTAESKLLEEKRRGDVLRLIPETSGTSKEPIIVVAKGEAFKMTSFKTQAVIAEGEYTAFPGALKKLNNTDQYVVVFFKPSAADFFHYYTDLVTKTGFQLGYDLIGEDIQFELPRP